MVSICFHLFVGQDQNRKQVIVRNEHLALPLVICSRVLFKHQSGKSDRDCQDAPVSLLQVSGSSEPRYIRGTTFSQDHLDTSKSIMQGLQGIGMY